MIRYAALLRLSDKKSVRKQAFNAAGTEPDIPQQREAIRAFAAQHPEWTFYREFIEAGVSAFKNLAEDRDVLQDALEDARAGRYQVLILFKQDRLSRQSDEYLPMLMLLKRSGVQVWTAIDGKQLQLNSHQDKMLRFLEGWQAEGESTNTSMRVKANSVILAKKGKWLGGPAPFGYKLAPKLDRTGMPVVLDGKLMRELVPNDEQAPCVREIFAEYIGGKGGLRIAEGLNARGVTTRTGGPWTAISVTEVVRNPIYAGYVRYARSARDPDDRKYKRTGEPIIAPSDHEAIITKEVWDKAQEVRDMRRRTPKRQLSDRYPLTGVLRCGVCGQAMGGVSRTVKGHLYESYRCLHHMRSMECPVKGYRKADVEAAFLEAIQELAMPGGLRELLAQQAQENETRVKDALTVRRRAEERLKEIEGALKALNVAYLEKRVFTDEEFTQQKAAYQAERQQLETELQAPLPAAETKDFGALAEAALQIRENWAYMEQQEKKVVVLELCRNWGVKPYVSPGPVVELRPTTEQ